MGVGPRRHDDDGHGALAAPGATAFEAVHTGQHEVDERHVGRCIGKEVKRLLPAGRIVDVVALTLEGQPHRRPNPFVVLDDQNAPAHSAPAQLIQI